MHSSSENRDCYCYLKNAWLEVKSNALIYSNRYCKGGQCWILSADCGKKDRNITWSDSLIVVWTWTLCVSDYSTMALTRKEMAQILLQKWNDLHNSSEEGWAEGTEVLGKIMTKLINWNKYMMNDLHSI